MERSACQSFWLMAREVRYGNLGCTINDLTLICVTGSFETSLAAKKIGVRWTVRCDYFVGAVVRDDPPISIFAVEVNKGVAETY